MNSLKGENAMNKELFLQQLRVRLQYLPPLEQQRTLSYYEEMIADRMEDGISEQEAVAALGPIENIVKDTYEDLGFTQLLQANMRMNTTNKISDKILIALIIFITAPFWLTFAVLAFSILISIAAVIFSLFIAFVAVIFAFGISAIACLAAFVIFIIHGQPLAALFVFGLMLVVAAITIALAPTIPTVGRGTMKVVKEIFRSAKKPLADRVGGKNEK